ncbi:DUF5994 family protein [Nocardia spumae]|uniref:DUF5994 family protein n=1 Tax=Nocardia spumae TaxID=2887190 RepID=UPI001D13DE7F|nr:DUF5994 family protein [Nocardia spumae]
MTFQQFDSTTAVPGFPPLRARINAAPPHTGWFDGGWWPYGDDLTAELPPLLAALTALVGTVHRVIYHPGDWDSATSGFDTDTTWVRLDGLPRKPAHTVDVLGVAGARIGLLVVPARTPDNLARAALETAATPGDTSRIEDLLERCDDTLGLRATDTENR